VVSTTWSCFRFRFWGVAGSGGVGFFALEAALGVATFLALGATLPVEVVGSAFPVFLTAALSADFGVDLTVVLDAAFVVAALVAAFDGAFVAAALMAVFVAALALVFFATAAALVGAFFADDFEGVVATSGVLSSTLMANRVDRLVAVMVRPMGGVDELGARVGWMVVVSLSEFRKGKINFFRR